jgi:hypothetical protein
MCVCERERERASERGAAAAPAGGGAERWHLARFPGEARLALARRARLQTLPVPVARALATARALARTVLPCEAGQARTAPQHPVALALWRVQSVRGEGQDVSA